MEPEDSTSPDHPVAEGAADRAELHGASGPSEAADPPGSAGLGDPAEPPGSSGPPATPAARRGRADHKESVRRDILDAARGLFACEGYGNVSLRKIAAQIGYTPMALYVHFRDKSEILDCICEETFDAFRANAERLDLLELPPRERLAAGLRAYVEFGLANPHHYQLTFMTPPCGGQTLGRRKEIGQDCYQRMRRRVALCMEQAEAGAPAADALEHPEVVARAESPEVELASQTIWTAVHGLVSLLIARPEFPWLERERLIDSVIEGALRTLGPAPAAVPPSVPVPATAETAAPGTAAAPAPATASARGPRAERPR